MNKPLVRSLAAAAALALLLAGCGSSPDTSSGTESGSTTTTTTTASTTTTTSADTTTTEDTTATTTGSGGVIGGSEEEEDEYLPQTALFAADNGRLADAEKTPGASVENHSDTAHLPEGADRGMRLSFNGNNWGQILLFHLEDGKEATLVDPCPDPLSDYDGLQLWLEIKPDAGGGVPDELIFIFGNWTYGYRDMFEYHYAVPDGGYTGYIEMPFSEMINAYPPNDKYYNADLIDFIGFKVVSGATIQNADIYMADLSAYREVFW